ncbi:oligosaccharide flippase family protein [Chitinophaga agrisoli]|uniref:Oligosaccharide flippase family protein n=1 Tax=Chitinophaga agrisoli TaxID=2607653 RepID=A0A5B2VHG0_9BACT|nr:oligosaccharide flippase family protein [Chitinophaga agrisoli]KAA2239013.1 oligosaccharide flippase family protein [Chitinophaga agrisoli]
MATKLFQNLSANTIQLVVNQLCGVAIFYLLSRQLTKNDFGQLNLALASLMLAFNMLSLGIDQVTIRRVAMGHNIKRLLSVYLFHVLITGLLFYAILVLCAVGFSQRNDLFIILLVLGLGKLMIFLSLPFKQVAIGMERFKVLAAMLITCNVARTAGLIIWAIFAPLTLHIAIVLFVLGDLAESVFTVYLFKRQLKVPIVFKWYKTYYAGLLRESLPQTGVVILTSAIARFDWIFIGVMVSSVKLAEYSFAYKAFEVSTLPLQAVAPLLLPWLTRLFRNGQPEGSRLRFLLRMELSVAVLTALGLNILWAPVIDTITAGKYGAVNVPVIFFLSLCIPFLYLNNFLWSIYFAQGRMRMLLVGFAITFLVNAGLDMLLIPFYGNEGAAVAFLASCMAQTGYYLAKNEEPGLRTVWQDLLLCITCALAGGFVARACFTSYYAVLPTALVLCVGLLFLARQLRRSDTGQLRGLLGR